MKITAACDSGLGAGLMIEMSIKDILKDLSISADADHVDLGSVKGTSSDIYVDTKDVVEQLVAQPVAGKIATLENMIDKETTRERLSAALVELDVL